MKTILLCFLFTATIFFSNGASEIVKVTCIGDSITSGGSSCASGSYVDDLRGILGPSYNVTNAGCSGKTQLKKGQCNGGGDCSYWNTETWQSAQQSEPHILTIMLGTNDAKAFNWEGVQQNVGDYYALDYVDMVTRMRAANPRLVVLLAVPPPLFEPYPFEMNKTVINEIFPILIRDLATVLSAPLVDVFSSISLANATTAELTCDGCHPTDYANKIIAQTFADAIIAVGNQVLQA
jgi:lysophospholipase L1-like esterase